MITREKMLEDFPQLAESVHGKSLIYLDNAASTLKTKSVIDRVHRHYSKEVSNIHRGVHYFSEFGTAEFEKTRDKVTSFINAKHRHEVIFTKGTTESINLVAACFGDKFFEQGDEILISTMEHHSNIVPWQLIAEKKGARVIEIPINDDGEILMEEYKKLLSPRTKMVSVNYVSNTLGTINPVKKMITLAHANGAKFLVDAAQSVGHIKTDVQDLDCDFLAFSAHKLYGPTGVGVLYGKEDLLNAMPPYQGGGDMIDEVRIEKTTFNTLPHKFEAGTPHIAGVIAFYEALEYIEKLGFEAIDKKEHELLEYATDKLQDIEGLRIIGTAKNKCSVLSFVIDSVHPQDLGTLLDQQGIAVRTGHHCTQPLMQRFKINATTRASFAFYNEKEDVEKLVAGIIKAKRLL